VTARKAGNVHRYRDFEDSTYLDFLASAAAIAPVMESAWKRQVGETVLASVLATRQVCRSNTNLGIILLLAPLATTAGETLRGGLPQVLERLNVEDAQLVYDAIRLARPSGLGRVEQEDVAEPSTQSLRQVMALAAGRDLVARQYANGFAQVLDEIAPPLRQDVEEKLPLEEAVVRSHLRLLATHPDSLIVRKRGEAEAAAVRERAGQVVQGSLGRADFDAWLREGGHGRNPGTTADLVTAGLFVGLVEGWLSPRHPF
jgi:triphosphoribosyl-dephospho-CoA synthase